MGRLQPPPGSQLLGLHTIFCRNFRGGGQGILPTHGAFWGKLRHGARWQRPWPLVQSPTAKADHVQPGTPKVVGTPKVMALMPSEHPKPAPSPQGGPHPPQGPSAPPAAAPRLGQAGGGARGGGGEPPRSRRGAAPCELTNFVFHQGFSLNSHPPPPRFRRRLRRSEA